MPIMEKRKKWPFLTQLHVIFGNFFLFFLFKDIARHFGTFNFNFIVKSVINQLLYQSLKFGTNLGTKMAHFKDRYSVKLGRIFGIGRYQFYLYRSFTTLFFSKNVTFTKFLSKKCESKFLFLPHCTVQLEIAQNHSHNLIFRQTIFHFAEERPSLL